MSQRFEGVLQFGLGLVEKASALGCDGKLTIQLANSVLTDCELGFVLPAPGAFRLGFGFGHREAVRESRADGTESAPDDEPEKDTQSSADQ